MTIRFIGRLYHSIINHKEVRCHVGMQVIRSPYCLDLEVSKVPSVGLTAKSIEVSSVVTEYAVYFRELHTDYV